MRLRRLKNEKELLTSSKYIIESPKEYCGKWKSVFGNNNPIHIEVGMGKGNFILKNAIKYPNINFHFQIILIVCLNHYIGML